jgi:hypothetical protein
VIIDITTPKNLLPLKLYSLRNMKLKELLASVFEALATSIVIWN